MNDNRLKFPPGWTVADAWAEQGVIVSVPAGAGVAPTAYTALISREIPAGARVYIDQLFLRVVDMAAYDQIFFALRRNGALIHPWNNISGEQVVEDFSVDVGEVLHSGLIEIVGKNISGTSEAGAMAPGVAIRCIARFKGFLLRERPQLRGKVA